MAPGAGTLHPLPRRCRWPAPARDARPTRPALRPDDPRSPGEPPWHNASWDDAFVDAICEPPQSFTYGGVVAHVLTYGAIRREALAGVLADG